MIKTIPLVTSEYSPNDFDLPVLTILRNILYYGLALPVFALVLLLIPVALISMRVGWPLVRGLLKTHLFLLGAVGGVNYEVVGRANLPISPYLIAARHQSIWETVFFHILLDNPAMLAKDTLFGLPLIGALMRKNGHIAIDRSGSIDAFRRAVAQAAEVTASQRSVLIFPQGTRAKEHNNDLKLGVLVLYRKLDCPCVPIVLNSGDFWPNNSWILRPGTIKIRILPAIETGLTSKEFLARITHDLETTV